jgi:hypothetical protein
MDAGALVRLRNELRAKEAEYDQLREILGVEGDQSLVDAARWFVDTTELGALRALERHAREMLRDPDDGMHGVHVQEILERLTEYRRR